MSQAAFSVMELVMVITVIGMLSFIVLRMVGTQPIAVRNAKLASDVASINHSIAIYVGDGGALTGTNAQTILDQLKKTLPQSQWKQHVGPLTGRSIDRRLRARITSVPEKNGQERARWNVQKQRFEITTGTGNAVSEFYLDEALATVDPGTAVRSTGTNGSTEASKVYNSVAGKNQGWVWENTATNKFTYNTPGSNEGGGIYNPFDPTKEKPFIPPGGEGGGDPGTGGGGTGNPGTGTPGTGTPQVPTATQLPRPTMTPAGGTFAYDKFPTSIVLKPNGAPTSGSVLEYRINNGPWIPYTNPLSVGSGDKLDTRNRATDTTLYKNSATLTGTYFRLASNFSGSSTATWGNAVGGPSLVTAIDNKDDVSIFKHGNSKLDLGNGEFLDTNSENLLTFTPRKIESVLPNTWFDLGDLLMFNGNTFYNSEADSVTLSINLNLTNPAKQGVVHIDLGLISTENTDDKLSSADIVELRNPTTDFKVTVDGVEYRLELSWTSLDAGAGVVRGNQFLVYETATAHALLRARFVPNK